MDTVQSSNSISYCSCVQYTYSTRSARNSTVRHSTVHAPYTCRQGQYCTKPRRDGTGHVVQYPCTARDPQETIHSAQNFTSSSSRSSTIIPTTHPSVRRQHRTGTDRTAIQYSTNPPKTCVTHQITTVRWYDGTNGSSRKQRRRLTLHRATGGCVRVQYSYSPRMCSSSSYVRASYSVGRGPDHVGSVPYSTVQYSTL